MVPGPFVNLRFDIIGPMSRLVAVSLAFALSMGLAVPVSAGPAAPAREKAATVRLRLSKGAERHIRERHFPGGRQTRGKSLFFASIDLNTLLAVAETAPARRQANGRDKRVVDADKDVGTDGRTGAPARRYVVISEPNGLVITAYPGD